MCRLSSFAPHRICPRLRLHPMQSLPHRSPLPQIPSSPRGLLRRLQKEALTPIRGPTIPIFFFSPLHLVVSYKRIHPPGEVLVWLPARNSLSELPCFYCAVRRRSLPKKNVAGMGFALSASDLLEVLHRFYPNAMPLTEKLSAPASQQAAQTAGQPLASEGAESSDSSKISSSSAPDGVGTVTISSDPDGAEIFIDDKFLGNAPATLKLPPGSHAVLLKFPGHADWRRILEVLKSSKVSLKANLEPGS